MSAVREYTANRWVVFGLPLLMVASAFVLRAFSYTSAGLDWDESLYIVIAQRWLAGGLPYVAVWDQHPMGLPAIFVGLISLMSNELLAARIGAFFAVTATAILLVRFLARFANAPLAGALAGLLYLFYMSRPEGLAANTEVFNNLIVMSAVFILYNELSCVERPISAWSILAAGLLFGIGLQIKYVVLPEAVFMCGTLLAWNLCRTRQVGRTAGLTVLAAIAGLTPTLLMTLYFWWSGALQPYLDGNIRANMSYIDNPTSAATTLLRLRYGLLPLAGLLPWPFVLAWLAGRSAVRRKYGVMLVWLAIWLVASLVDVAMPLKLWKHYFNAMIPPLCIMAGLGICLCARRVAFSRGAVIAVVTALVVAPAIGSMVKHAPDSRTVDRVNVPRAIADDIVKGGTNQHDVYIFNYDPLVYAYAHAVPPTRYVLGIDLAEFDIFSGVKAEFEIGRVLAENPRWIVVADPSPYKYPPDIWAKLTNALHDYELVTSYTEADYIQPPIAVRLYRRHGPNAGADCPAYIRPRQCSRSS